jgi:hypothetical protein
MKYSKFIKWAKEKVGIVPGLSRYEYYQLHKGIGHSTPLQTLKALRDVWRQETGENITINELIGLIK